MKKFTLAVLFLATSLAYAENYRITNPEAWEAVKTADAIKALYGTNVTHEDARLKVIAPKLAENGGSIPISIKSTIPAKSIAVFQDANPRALTTIFSVNDNEKSNYALRIKMRQTANMTVVVEGLDGKLYAYAKEIDVSIGGCGGG
ncbi:Sulfur oxidation protein SoxY [hydrothermal vent metagenome]|uniref:Sulfur oxidation protein SoxY n=1 Tax=hydrothermal vent metagenome TaxID=652676 RepID=A0A1W1CTW8_9ZZZZ